MTRRPESPALTAIEQVGSSDNARALARLLTALLLIVIATLIWTPWRQNIVGRGRVAAFDPVERRQTIQAPIDGRVVRWAVVEGSPVKKGDLLVEISDNDPALVERMLRERAAIEGTLSAAQRRAGSFEDKANRLAVARTTAMSAARSRIQTASDKIRAAEKALEAAEADHETARLNRERRDLLAARGLVSTRDMELATLQFNTTAAAVAKARADLDAERNSKLALEAELERVDADSQSKVDDALASFASAESDAEKARAELTKIDVRLSRQASQSVTAPLDGEVFRVVAKQGGEMVKAGDVLAVLVPRSSKDIVELWVDGNDAPLISPGRKVRLQFEGWPALQFSGWPSIAVGTFGGRVLQIDAADSRLGEFRLLVEQDPDDEPWPSKPYLRQGVAANGWVLLNKVSLGYELWRQFNGFPPFIASGEPATGDFDGAQPAGAQGETSK